MSGPAFDNGPKTSQAKPASSQSAADHRDNNPIPRSSPKVTGPVEGAACEVPKSSSVSLADLRPPMGIKAASAHNLKGQYELEQEARQRVDNTMERLGTLGKNIAISPVTGPVAALTGRQYEFSQDGKFNSEGRDATTFERATGALTLVAAGWSKIAARFGGAAEASAATTASRAGAASTAGKIANGIGEALAVGDKTVGRATVGKDVADAVIGVPDKKNASTH